MPGSRVPKKPDGGWPLLVIPLLGDGQRGTPFVANPDASKRPLTDDEELYLNYFKQEMKTATGGLQACAWYAKKMSGSCIPYGISTQILGILPKLFSRPRRHAPFTNETLHMFNQKKPNAKHDIYNPPYLGTRMGRTPTSGPTHKERRRKRMHRREQSQALKRALKSVNR